MSMANLELDWRDVRAIGEMKSKNNNGTLKKSFIEAASKAALLLYAQDGRHSAPCLQILDKYIVLSFFDRGGSLLTTAFDIHKNPDIFLHILLGVSTAPIANIGFDKMVFWDDKSRKTVLVVWNGSSSEQNDEGNSAVFLDQLIFISDVLHGHGTTVWAGSMKDPASQTSQQQVIVKDSWIDPLQRFMEGCLLARLNDANVEGVAWLIHKQQVQGPHLSHGGVKINMSTHLLHKLLWQLDNRQYQLHVLSCLLMEPVGMQIMSFSSLAQLLVAFIDYVLTHKDAIDKAKVLHCNISLLNLLLVHWSPSTNGDHCLDFLINLLLETCEHLQDKIWGLSYQGLLVDWGYATPLDALAPDSEHSPKALPSTPPHNLPPTSPISLPHNLALGDDSVPIQISDPDKIKGHIIHITLAELKDDHAIALSMGRDSSLDQLQLSINTNPLYCTGMWSWMAAELVTAGPDKPVSHMASHDLESMFYILLGICVLFDELHCLKSETKLAQCFDMYFNKFEPSLHKTITIQSQFGWSFKILQHISPYFQPLIPLLNVLQEKIIMLIAFTNDSFYSSSHITHDEMCQALIAALCEIDDQCWVSRTPQVSESQPGFDSQFEVRSESSPDLSSDSELGESLDLVTPQLPCPPTIHRVSRPGFTSTNSSGTRRWFSSVKGHSDSAESWATKHS
ncbi:hypothetical protein EDC04DRAFT_2914418 [Pisolithus marmoratus]|nr:hypothetical protein EDC04DRAFT_2914418 [Pisolithus marmoratus]